MNALMGSFMSMPGMNMGVNPFVQLLNQSGIGGPNWTGLSGIYNHLISYLYEPVLIVGKLKLLVPRHKSHF